VIPKIKRDLNRFKDIIKGRIKQNLKKYGPHFRIRARVSSNQGAQPIIAFQRNGGCFVRPAASPGKNPVGDT